MDFDVGDIQFLNNGVILHSRTEYEDYDELESKRHLLRLWLKTHDFSVVEDLLREGILAKPVLLQVKMDSRVDGIENKTEGKN